MAQATSKRWRGGQKESLKLLAKARKEKGRALWPSKAKRMGMVNEKKRKKTEEEQRKEVLTKAKKARDQCQSAKAEEGGSFGEC